MKNKEIERKFLVKSNFLELIGKVQDVLKIRQGYMFDSENGVARVRQQDSQYFLAFKSPVIDTECDEIEFEISEDKGLALFNKFTTKTLSKLRYIVEHKGHTWEIDYFQGKIKGLVVAEIELQSKDEKFDMPDWLLEEVTGNESYYNSNLVNI